MIELLFLCAVVLYVMYNIPLAIASDRAYKRGYRAGYAKGKANGAKQGREDERGKLVEMIGERRVGVGNRDSANACYWVRIPIADYEDIVAGLEDDHD